MAHQPKHQWSYVKLLNAWGPWYPPGHAKDGNDGGFRIMWACELGIGELTFYNDKNGVLHCETETLDDEFCQEMLTQLYLGAKKEPC